MMIRIILLIGVVTAFSIYLQTNKPTCETRLARKVTVIPDSVHLTPLRDKSQLAFDIRNNSATPMLKIIGHIKLVERTVSFMSSRLSPSSQVMHSQSLLDQEFFSVVLNARLNPDELHTVRIELEYPYSSIPSDYLESRPIVEPSARITYPEIEVTHAFSETCSL